MTSMLTPELGVEREPRPALRRTGPLLVATDGRRASDAALAAAFLLAGRFGADVEVIAVREPLPRYGPLIPAPELERSVDERLLEAVRKQIARTDARDANWPVRLLIGSPADVLANHASEHDARLILIGRGGDMRHRALGGALAMRMAQLSDVPILSVASPFHALPRRALVALDFSPRSLSAARSAIAVASDAATTYLAHVIPRLDGTSNTPEQWEAIYAEGLSEAYDAARRKVNAPPTSIVETLTLHGDPARELLTAATQTGADLIACGTHGYGFIQRTIIGSVATHLLRGAKCSVLLVPDGALNERAADATHPLEQDAWEEMLRRFTVQNAGRRAILEIDDPTIGAQAQVVDYPFLGAVLDPQTWRAELMLGGRNASLPHLTHAIENIRSLDVMKDGDGRDRVLRIAYDGGQALLTLTT